MIVILLGNKVPCIDLDVIAAVDTQRTTPQASPNQNFFIFYITLLFHLNACH
jgi:hypothetical protein